MVTVSATIALAQNGYTTTDITAVNCEYVIDAAIDYVNLRAGTSISALSGAAGSKTTTCTRDENAALSPLITLMLREYKRTALSASDSTSSSVGTGGSSSFSLGPYAVSESTTVSSAISATTSLTNSMDTYTVSLFEAAVRALIGRSFLRT